jgi:hypothetical protein
MFHADTRPVTTNKAGVISFQQLGTADARIDSMDP